VVAGLAQFRALNDSGNRSATSLDTYTNRWNKLLLPRVKSLRISEFTPAEIDQILQDLNAARTILSGLCGDRSSPQRPDSQSGTRSPPRRTSAAQTAH
jgi:hypothetical protein